MNMFLKVLHLLPSKFLSYFRFEENKKNIINYPKSFIRGISGSQSIDQKGYVKADLFMFDEKQKIKRDDNKCELSINWYDDEGAMQEILHRIKKDHIQFKVGAAVVDTEDLEEIKKTPQINKLFDYERKIDEQNKDNVYHGNLLFPLNDFTKSDIKDKKYMIGSLLAAKVKYANIRQKNPDGTDVIVKYVFRR